MTLLLLELVLALRPVGPPLPYDPVRFPIVVAIVALLCLGLLLWSQKVVTFDGRVVGRADQPALYWAFVAALAAIIAVSIAYAATLSGLPHW